EDVPLGAGEANFFLELAQHRLDRGLARIEPAAGQRPLAGVGAQPRDAPREDEGRRAVLGIGDGDRDRGMTRRPLAGPGDPRALEGRAAARDFRPGGGAQYPHSRSRETQPTAPACVSTLAQPWRCSIVRRTSPRCTEPITLALLPGPLRMFTGPLDLTTMWGLCAVIGP